MKEYVNAAKNYGIAEGKVLEYMRELTGGEATARWAERHRDGTG